MKRSTVLTTAILVILASAEAFCETSAPAQAGVVQAVTGFVLHPWVAALLVFVGMALVISEILSIGDWGVTGTAGILAVGSVVGSALVAGIAAWAGVALLLAGVGLVLVESRVLPGRAISGIAGLACMFLGMFWVLGGASAGTLYAASVSALFVLMAAVAFLVHLPHNSAWRTVGRRLEISVGHPYGALSEESDRASQEQAPGRRSVRADDESDDDQQIIRRT